MKKNLLYVLLALGFPFLFASCNDKEPVVPVPDDPVKFQRVDVTAGSESEDYSNYILRFSQAANYGGANTMISLDLYTDYNESEGAISNGEYTVGTTTAPGVIRRSSQSYVEGLIGDSNTKSNIVSGVVKFTNSGSSYTVTGTVVDEKDRDFEFEYTGTIVFPTIIEPIPDPIELVFDNGSMTFDSYIGNTNLFRYFINLNLDVDITKPTENPYSAMQLAVIQRNSSGLEAGNYIYLGQNDFSVGIRGNRDNYIVMYTTIPPYEWWDPGYYGSHIDRAEIEITSTADNYVIEGSAWIGNQEYIISYSGELPITAESRPHSTATGNVEPGEGFMAEGGDFSDPTMDGVLYKDIFFYFLDDDFAMWFLNIALYMPSDSDEELAMGTYKPDWFSERKAYTFIPGGLAPLGYIGSYLLNEEFETYAPLFSGEFTIAEEDGIYTLDFDFLDDMVTGQNRIYGQYVGEITLGSPESASVINSKAYGVSLPSYMELQAIKNGNRR